MFETCDPACDSQSECLFGKCTKCSICGEISDRIVAGLTLSNFDLSKVLNITDLIETTRRVLKVGELVLANITDAATQQSIQILELVDQAAVALELNNSWIFDKVIAPVAATSSLIIARSARLLLSQLNLANSTKLYFILDAANVSLGFAEAELQQIIMATNKSCDLYFSGEGDVILPANATGWINSTGVVIHLGGNVRVQGSVMGGSTVVLAQVESASPRATVPSGASLTLSGNVLGAQGTVFVSGTMETASLVFEPLLAIGQGGLVNVRGSSFSGGDLSLLGSADSASGSLMGARGALIRIFADGAVTYFTQILACMNSASIEYVVKGSLIDFLAPASESNPITGRVFNYDIIMKDFVAQFQCVVKLVDEAGNSKTLTSTVKASGRRLLSTGASTAVWGATALEYAVTDSKLDSVGFPVYASVLIGMTVASFLLFVLIRIYQCRKAKNSLENVPLSTGSRPEGSYSHLK